MINFGVGDGPSFGSGLCCKVPEAQLLPEAQAFEPPSLELACALGWMCLQWHLKGVSTEILGNEELQSPAIAAPLALCSRDQRQRKGCALASSFASGTFATEGQRHSYCQRHSPLSLPWLPSFDSGLCCRGPEARLLPEAQPFEPPLALYWEPQADRLLVAIPMEWQRGGSWS